MTIKLGSTTVTDIRVGATPITAVRIGSTLAWTRANTLRDDFNRTGAADIDASHAIWADDFHDDPTNLASVFNNTCRMNIPDGFIAIGTRYNRRRYLPAQTSGDDGYIECKIAAIGTGGSAYLTQVFRRLSNGAFTDGVGIQFGGSNLSIVRRLANVESSIACGSYQTGDVCRLIQAGDNHLLLRNGLPVGGWADTGSTAHRGAGYRSMGIVVSGAKPPFFIYPVGPIQLSAALDYVEAA